MNKEYITKLNEMVGSVEKELELQNELREGVISTFYQLKGYLSALETLIK